MPTFSNTEQRVLLGIVFFFGLLLLLGWVFIKEDSRMAEFTAQFAARSIENGAAIYESNCATCHGLLGQGIPQRAPALHNPRLFNGERLRELTWPGGVRDYIENAIAGGRPNSGAYWNGNIMPTWSEEFGGPLRVDQINNLVDFIMNWEATALDEENPPEVTQDFVLPGESVGGAVAPPEQPVCAEAECPGLDVTTLQLVAGDRASGEALYTALGCAGCHTGGAVGPPTAGTAARVADLFASEERFAAYTAPQYLAESILQPNAYIAINQDTNTAYPSLVMPPNFGTRLDLQQLSDLVAYLETE